MSQRFKFTKEKLESLPLPSKRTTYYDRIVSKLAACVTPGGAISFYATTTPPRARRCIRSGCASSVDSFVRWRFVVSQVIAAAEKYIPGYGCEPSNPSLHVTRRNTQKNRELLHAALQEGTPPYDALRKFSIHTAPSVAWSVSSGENAGLSSLRFTAVVGSVPLMLRKGHGTPVLR
jgi:hypothetical protein